MSLVPETLPPVSPHAETDSTLMQMEYIAEVIYIIKSLQLLKSYHLACYVSCATCNGSDGNQCLTCKSPLLFDSDANTCTDNCTSGNYLSTTTNSCETCHSSCLECALTDTTCTKCDSNSFLSTSTCVNECPSLTYADSSRECKGEPPSLCFI